MLVIDSPRAKALAALAWLAFALPNCVLTYVVPGQETIPYHLVWFSFMLVYGLADWPVVPSVAVLSGIVLITGVPLVVHASNGYIGWEECSEIALMAGIAVVVMWHVRRAIAARARLAALRAAEQDRAALRELTARFGSHELRTRLTIARSAVELLRSSGGDRARADADLAIGELEKGLATATNLLTLVHVTDPARLVTVDAGELIADLARRWEIRADRAWTFAASQFVFAADPDRFEAALDCLIENAVKFTEEYDEIVVEAWTDGPDVIFRVRDSGAGIPDADLRRVLQPFETSSAAGDRAGTGLGLAIARTVVASRGGELEVRSRLGEGTEVLLRSPRTPRAHLPSPGSSRGVGVERKLRPAPATR